MAKYSKEAQATIGAKMHKMKGEDRPQAQKVAIAMSEVREKGLKVPARRKRGKRKTLAEKASSMKNLYA